MEKALLRDFSEIVKIQPSRSFVSNSIVHAAHFSAGLFKLQMAAHKTLISG